MRTPFKECERGFTLLELLVVITLMGIIVGASFAAFGVGIKGFRQTVRKGALVQEGRGALLLMKRDIERAIPVTVEGVAFEDSSLSFPVVRAVDGNNELKLVSYALESGNLARRISSPGSKDEGSIAYVARGVKSLTFEYTNVSQGQEGQKPSGDTTSQPSADNVEFPAAVRVTFTLVMDDEEKSFLSSFALPVAVAVKAGKEQPKEGS